MLFSSSVFIYLFLPATLIGYYVLKFNRKIQNAFLLFVSLFFYAWGEPKFVLIMILSIFMNWIFGLRVHKQKQNQKIKAAKAVISVSFIFNLSILYVFKYLSFSIGIVKDIFSLSVAVPNIALPIGISFFTFQAMSYVIDVYRGNGVVQKSILNVGLYISFFPQLIAGPIVRYETIADQIENRKESVNDFVNGFARFVIGLSKKVLLANNFAIVADGVFDRLANDLSISLLSAWLGAICYTLQIFFDFSGYSDMAIGLGQMFGFHFLENFNYPYISKSVSEFWRRWHISLGTWFRDYVYIPLGGSRVNKNRLVFNLFVVWTLTGIWHGANWTFLIWGLMYFVLLSIEKLTKFGEFLEKAKIINWIYTMFFVVIGWVIFRSNSINDAFEYIKVMFGIRFNTFCGEEFKEYFMQIITWLIFGVVFSFPVIPKMKEKIKKDNIFLNIIYVIVMIILFMLSISSIVSDSYNPFIYFNF